MFKKNTNNNRSPVKNIDKPVFPMRINKYLAMTGHSTRRGADELIEKGQVFINGKKAVLGDKVTEKDNVNVTFTGKQKPYVYFAYNKPRGVITYSSDESEEDIKKQRNKNKTKDAKTDVFPVGRLDKDSHGLIILTNDGRITDRLLSPSYEHEKEYVVSVKGKLRSSFKEKMEAGVQIEDDKTLPCKVEIINEDTFRVILKEGKKHQIRRMCVALFQEVSDLKRIRVMNIRLGKLKDGEERQIEGEELETFLSSLGLKK